MTSLLANQSVLIVEDLQSLAVLYAKFLTAAGFITSSVGTGKDCLEQIEKSPPRILVLDLDLPDMAGIEVLRFVQKNWSTTTSVVVVTGNASLAVAIDAMRHGAFDYLVKPFSGDRLVATVEGALEQAKNKPERRTAHNKAVPNVYPEFIGSSTPMQSVYRTIDSAANSKATVFISGESGTGKDVCARAIHERSSRSQGPFVALNCAAIPRELMESEIFGHIKGAFTGAVSDRLGAAAQADKGTLFLDEVCEMSIDLQSKMLRLLQNSSFQRVGSNRTDVVDIRIICATNKDPIEEIRRGRFREDLYYRLFVIPITMPPLRERGGDIAEIARALLHRYSCEEGRSFRAFSAEAEQAIGASRWPGNVRQLQNVIRRSVVLYDGDVIEREMLQFPVDGGMRQEASDERNGLDARKSDEIRPLWQVERDAILHALSVCEGNVARAAAFLQVGVSTLYRKKVEFQPMQSSGWTSPPTEPPAAR